MNKETPRPRGRGVSVFTGPSSAASLRLPRSPTRWMRPATRPDPQRLLAMAAALATRRALEETTARDRSRAVPSRSSGGIPFGLMAELDSGLVGKIAHASCPARAQVQAACTRKVSHDPSHYAPAAARLEPLPPARLRPRRPGPRTGPRPTHLHRRHESRPRLGVPAPGPNGQPVHPGRGAWRADRARRDLPHERFDRARGPGRGSDLLQRGGALFQWAPRLRIHRPCERQPGRHRPGACSGPRPVRPRSRRRRDLGRQPSDAVPAERDQGRTALRAHHPEGLPILQTEWSADRRHRRRRGARGMLRSRSSGKDREALRNHPRPAGGSLQRIARCPFEPLPGALCERRPVGARGLPGLSGHLPHLSRHQRGRRPCHGLRSRR